MVDISTQDELNQAALDVLEIVADLDEKKREQERYLQAGYLCLAKARYSMGVDRVSSLQYPSTMEPLLSVQYNLDDAENCFSLIKCNEELSKTKTDCDNKPTTTVTRRKNIDKITVDENQSEITEKMNALNVSESNFVKEVADKKLNSNPLKWFGVLVPLPLRQAQEQFTKAAEVSCEISNLNRKFYIAEKKLKSCQAIFDKADKDIINAEASMTL